MTSVFVSYRRDDSRHQAGRLYDHLVEKFGKEHVFKDVDSIPLGSDFREILTERVGGCDVFLAVIGDTWLTAVGPSGTRRLDEPGDFVRIEIEAALARSIPVIPVLVGNASVPRPEELPDSLRELAYGNGLPVRPNPDFEHDVKRLIRGINAAVSSTPETSNWRSRRVGLAACAAVLGVLLLSAIVYVTSKRSHSGLDGDAPKGATGKETPETAPPLLGSGGAPAGPPKTVAAESPSPPTAAAPELVAFYDFNDGAATDRSGHRNHGTLSANPPSFTSQGYQGGALSFEGGKKTYVTIPVDINPSVMPQVTMGGWFNLKSADTSTGAQGLLSNDDGAFDRALVIDHRGGDGGLRWKVFTGSKSFGGVPAKPGRWTFAVMRHDQGTRTLTMDVDGRRDKTDAFYGLGAPRTTIGKSPRYPNFFTGTIDNIFIYKGILADEKVADIRARGEAAITAAIGAR
jgi:TIR domain/Concanavalin A-like lectin/glucanases superfamily